MLEVLFLSDFKLVPARNIFCRKDSLVQKIIGRRD